MIKLENLSKGFENTPVINELNLDFEDNNITCIFSASGAGKTTMLRIIAGLESPDTGKISGAGKISVTFQEDRLFPWLTAHQNIEVVSDATTAQELLERVELTLEADKYPSELSGGMCRRIAFARSLAVKSDTLILDEPLKGLDLELKKKMYELILDYANDKAVIMSTHDMLDAASIADRVLYFSSDGFKLKKDIIFDIPKNQRNEEIIDKYIEQIREY